MLRCLLCFLFLITALAALSQDLTSLSFEDFMAIKVSSASKTPRKVSHTPAAVFVISHEEIRRSPYKSLPEVLRLAPGVHVARISGTSWAVGIRGFNGFYSNKLLVMIDGRTVYNGLFSGVLWSENLIMMEDVERIEVIRGPGATMWGANAVSGVINVITKSARATEGGFAAISGGVFDPVRATMRYGGRSGNTAWRTWAQYSLQGQTDQSPAGPRPRPWPSAVVGARIELAPTASDSVLVEGQFHQNSSPVPQSATAGGLPPTMTIHAGSTGGSLMMRWDHTNRRGDVSALQIYDTYDAVNANTVTAKVQTLDVDFHHSIQLDGGHALMLGAAARSTQISTKGTSAFTFDPAKTTDGIFSLYVQDEWTVARDRLTLEFGARIETFTKFGSALEPTARLMWTPTAKTGYWVSVSRAVRTPAFSDYGMRLPITPPGSPVSLLLMGSNQFRPEVLKGVETGARFEINRSLGFDVSLFRHYYTGLHTFQLSFSPGPSALAGMIASVTKMPTVPALATNGRDGVNQGAEATVRYDIQSGWQVSGSYSSLFSGTSYRPGWSRDNSVAIASYTPTHQWQIRTSRQFQRHWSADLVLRRTGDLAYALPRSTRTLDSALPGFTQLDCRIARRLGEFMEFSASGTNLVRPNQREFVGDILYPAGLVRRSIEVGLSWSF